MIVQSPCKGICKLHPIHKLCQGCYRSPLELRQWSTATPEKQLDTIEQCLIRKELYGDINDKRTD